jgi:hypothetical protein
MLTLLWNWEKDFSGARLLRTANTPMFPSNTAQIDFSSKESLPLSIQRTKVG